MKLQHWRAFSATFMPEGAPMLEFVCYSVDSALLYDPSRRRQAARIREGENGNSSGKQFCPAPLEPVGLRARHQGMSLFTRTPPRRRQAARIREAHDMPQGMSCVHTHPSASAQIFFAHVIAYCPSNSLDCADTPPEPGTAFMVLATSSYLWTEAT